MAPAFLTVAFFLPVDIELRFAQTLCSCPAPDQSSSAGLLQDLLLLSSCVPSVPVLSSIVLSTISGPELGWLRVQIQCSHHY